MNGLGSVSPLVSGSVMDRKTRPDGVRMLVVVSRLMSFVPRLDCTVEVGSPTRPNVRISNPS